MKEVIIVATIGTAIYFAFFAPWLYLLGVLTSYVPTYLFLFRKSIDRIDEKVLNFPLSKKRLEKESYLMHKVRQIIVAGVWGFACVFLWWMFLLISMSKRSTEMFIKGFSEGMV